MGRALSIKTSSLIIRLIDQVTGPAGKVAASVKGLNSAIAQNNARLDAMRGRMVDAVGAGYLLAKALGSPLTAAQKFETQLLDIAQKAELGDDAMKALGKQIRETSGRFNTSASEFAKGVDFLLGMGLDKDRAMEIMPDITKAAVAYTAEIQDLAKAGFSALDNLKVPANQFAKALDAMATSGKMGAFELKDMAAEFPSLTAAAQALQITGVGGVAKLAAALQIARKGAGTSAEAATNTANLMQKIISPDTTKKFQKAGIDIRKELKKVQATGGDVFEMIASLITKATKGDLSKLGDFFQDAQVQKFLLPLIQNIDEYRKIRDAALGANGTVEEDYQRRLKTSAASMALFKARVENIAIAIGSILLPAFNKVLDVLGPFIQRITALAEAHPALVRNIIAAASGLVAFRIAAVAASWAGLFMFGGLLKVAFVAAKAAAGIALLARALLIAPAVRMVTAAVTGLRSALITTTLVAGIAGKGTAFAMIGRTLLGLLNPIKLVSAAMVGLKWALRGVLIGTGIGVALVALGVAVEWVRKNWENLTIAFEAFKGAFVRGMAPLRDDPGLAWIAKGAEDALDAISNLTAEGDVTTFVQAGIAAGKMLAGAFVTVAGAIQNVADLISWVSEKWAALNEFDLRVTNMIVEGAKSAWAGFEAWWDGTVASFQETLSGLPGMFSGIGSDAIQSLWDGMVARFEAMLSWLAGLPGRIASAVGNIDLSGIFKWPSSPDWAKRIWGSDGGDEAQPASPAAPAAPQPDRPIDFRPAKTIPPQAAPVTTQVDVNTSSVDEATAKANEAGAEISSALNVTVKPTADLSSIADLKSMVGDVLRMLSQLGPAAQQAQAAVGRSVGASFKNRQDHVLHDGAQ